MNLDSYTRKDIGDLGERVACEYLRRAGFTINNRNVSGKMGELDIVAEKGNTLHFIEVKSLKCKSFPNKELNEGYHPANNLHTKKVRKVVRTAEWFVACAKWKGVWQVDAALVWLRDRDGLARVSYYPQIL